MNFTELKKLNLPAWKYAIFWSWPLWIRKIRESNDIDILVTQGLWDELITKYPENLIKEPYEHMQIWEIEIMKKCRHLTSEEVNRIISNSEIIEGFPFVKLENLKNWKQKMWREKDLNDIKLINWYLNKNQKNLT